MTDEPLTAEKLAEALRRYADSESCGEAAGACRGLADELAPEPEPEVEYAAGAVAKIARESLEHDVRVVRGAVLILAPGRGLYAVIEVEDERLIAYAMESYVFNPNHQTRGLIDRMDDLGYEVVRRTYD